MTSTAVAVSRYGLDLTDPDDRAIYRQRVADAYRHCRVTHLVDLAEAAGAPRPPARRADATRALANAWIRSATGSTPS